MYTLGEFHKNRNNSTVFEELSVSIVDLTVANFHFTGSASPVKRIIATIKSTNDTSNSQIQYCYSLILLYISASEIWPDKMDGLWREWPRERLSVHAILIIILIEPSFFHTSIHNVHYSCKEFYIFSKNFMQEHTCIVIIKKIYVLYEIYFFYLLEAFREICKNFLS